MERKLNECGILRQAQATAFDWLMHCLALTWKTAFLIAILLQTVIRCSLAFVEEILVLVDLQKMLVWPD